MQTLARPADDVLIVGAGMAGLTAATELARAGYRVLVLDKGRAVGGRLASRRIGEATFDHGAQFITARTPRFADAVEHWRRSGMVDEWCRGFGEHVDGHPRWRGRPTMTSVARHLAHGREVVLEGHVVALQCSGDRWRVQTNSGASFSSRAVVLTPPVPQSLAIMESGGVVLHPETTASLSSIEYERCLAVMAVTDAPSRLLPPGGLAPAHGPISWIADNQLKAVSAVPAVTIHASHAFSLEHWDRDRQQIGRQLLRAANEWLGARVETFQVHGWRYSKPMTSRDQPCVIANESPLLVLAGDAFAGPRVEGASLSGWAAAEAIMSASA
jgi:predicted NAD/FAD-dependent oxidoreductase